MSDEQRSKNLKSCDPMDDLTVARGEHLQHDLEGSAYRSSGLGLTRDTRATVDQVLDQKTIEVVNKLIKQGHFDELAGCISTGKEANVYFGVKNDGTQVAVKIYKTSILGFRDRDEYVEGEFRFRHGYCKSNPRKMVSLWAEKEQRNLNRLSRAGIPCPLALVCKRNVLVMSLAGESGRAAPRLKDVVEDLDWGDIYKQVILSVRKMFQQCKLVHGDLSEYNMLLENGTVIIIDVSQSVGTDHPRSLEFLKRDCFNVNQFFTRKVDEESVVPLQDLFHFIISEQGMADEETLWLSLEEQPRHSSPQVSDTVFMETWIPASLSEIADMREVERLLRDRDLGERTVFDDLVAVDTESVDDDSSEDELCDSDDSDSCSESSVTDNAPAGGFDGHKPEGMTKQEWKKIVKEERREARKSKVPKHLKHKRNLKKYGKK